MVGAGLAGLAAAAEVAEAGRTVLLLDQEPGQSLLEAASGPLIAVRLHVLTRKTLGGRVAGRAAAAAVA